MHVRLWTLSLTSNASVYEVQAQAPDVGSDVKVLSKIVELGERSIFRPIYNQALSRDEVLQVDTHLRVINVFRY